MPLLPSESKTLSPTTEWVRLVAVGLVIAVTWGFLLPKMSRQSTIQAMIARNEALGINAGAKFYTESASSQHAQSRLDSLQRRKPNALWTWSHSATETQPRWR